MLQLRSKVRRPRQGRTYRCPSQSRAAPSLLMANAWIYPNNQLFPHNKLLCHALSCIDLEGMHVNLTAMISHNFCQNPLPNRFDRGDGLARHDVT